MKKIEELEKIIRASEFSKLSKRERVDILFERKLLLNKSFEFNRSQTLKIREINKILWQKMNEVYENVKAIKEDLDALIKSGKTLYKDYFIEGKICIDSTTTDSAILFAISRYINYFWTVNAYEKEEMPSHSKALRASDNWNIETFQCIKNDYIYYATHAIFVDDTVLSLKDMINLKETDIEVYTEIYI